MFKVLSEHLGLALLAALWPVPGKWKCDQMVFSLCFQLLQSLNLRLHVTDLSNSSSQLCIFKIIG